MVMTARTIDALAKLEEFYIPEPNSGCWLWIGCAPRAKPYGHLTIQGKLWKAHRLSWTLFRGPIPDGMHVCHKCDVPSCVNPEHLFLGTNADNVADKVRKGRARTIQGSQSHTAKMTEDDVRRIRLENWPLKRIEETFGISKNNASKAKLGRTWKHVEM